ncbi:MAG: histone-like nucleoid-structuring protein Lsr2, partial [Pseudonocardiaceae bacterium]
MAQQQSVVLVDDLDGSTAEQTVVFSVDGQQYEIDLSGQNVQRLHDILAPYLTKARKVGSERGAGRPARRPRTDVPVTAPAAERSSGEVAASQDSATPGPRPPVPAALFSNPDQHLPPVATTAPKPHTAGLFSTAG